MNQISSYVASKASIFFPYFAQGGTDTITDNCNPSANANDSFFALPVWWKYIKGGVVDDSGVCVPSLNFSTRPYEIWAIALAIIEMLMRIAGFVAVVYIIIAGVNYIASNGNPEEANKARQRIINGFVGLAIVLVAVVSVSFIGKAIGD